MFGDGDDSAGERLTHFPHDFSETLTDLPPLEELDEPPLIPYFNPSFKLVGIGDWSVANQHDRERVEVVPGHELVNPNTPVYLVAETELDHDSFQTYLTPDGPVDRPVGLDEVDFIEGEVDGDPVYEEWEVFYDVGRHVGVELTPLRIRQEIVDELMSNGGRTTFPVGTHIAYGMRDITVRDDTDDRIAEHDLPGHGSNPFDYLSDEKQEAFLEIYEELYGMYEEAGFFPFTDVTESTVMWHEPGTFEGVWTRDDVEYYPYHRFESKWEVISLVGIDKPNAETYWRVLEHPWNVEHNLVGLFYDDFFTYVDPEQPLYEGDPLWASRCYLIEGDLSGGVAMIVEARDADMERVFRIDQGDFDGWNPWQPDTASNHPSTGERRYLRFDVREAGDLWDELLEIEGFTTEAAARDGFTADSILYRRDPDG